MTINILRNRCLTLSAAVLLAACAFSRAVNAAEEPPKRERGGPVAGPTASRELVAEIAEKDRIFFDAFFNKCDVETVGNFITEDFEFYHDKGGLTATSRAQFVESIRNMCARQKTGEDYRARREVVEGSMEVYPLNNYGAIEVGVHRFYRITEGKGEKLVEISQFTIVWKKDESGWKMSRVLSYDHKLTE
jgi:ketosteroid isomerase-like protein